MNSFKSTLTFSSAESNKSLKRYKKFKTDFLNFCEQTATISEFTENILKLPYFKSFYTFGMLIHEKGNQSSIYWKKSIGSSVDTNLISTSTFNTLFSTVKKSKNKIFMSFKGPSIDDLGLHGSFLAREFIFKNHNVLLFLSRQDLLPPSKDEIATFHSFTDWTPALISRIISTTKDHQRITTLETFYREYPVPISLTSNTGEVIFCNSSSLPTAKESFPLSDQFSLNIYESNNSNLDLFHYQRIFILGELLNTLRHEINNPLFGLQLACQLLSHLTENKENIETIDDISKNISRGQNILGNFTNLFTTSDAPTPTDLKKIIEECITLTKSESRGLAKIIIKSEGNEFGAHINPTWVVQILFNLIINSIHAIISKNQFGLITITLETDTNHTNLWHISVSDTGCGISKSSIQNIFEPFYTTKSAGNGLGLSLSRELARRMSGDLYFEHPADMPGATFHLLLPKIDSSHGHLNHRG